MVTERVDGTSPELRGEALAVPIREQSSQDDGLLDPGREPLGLRAATAIPQRFETAGRIPPSPAMQAGPADPEGQGRGDAVLIGRAHAADAEAQAGQILAGPVGGWPAATRGEEEEPGTLLVSMAQWTTMGIGACARHVATLGTPSTRCLINPGNYI